ncbi:hypothetical protein DACRYDRAFT_19919 [Dacryopinax primogenitus]|uniref:Uncharacterized protein n=1 Tax=Dacryopinax primogenitus (strain DJM 731) TaxID=1858805 RepID=M5GAM5_DACPD|nr:uncharacterized protein DACRYDRAFT_19919 [Dacryopinax primogenitus]EJU05415.1 hypothetical protein DACRYDRAFT_19919 [Dacryopinax primogenitus]
MSAGLYVTISALLLPRLIVVGLALTLYSVWIGLFGSLSTGSVREDPQSDTADQVEGMQASPISVSARKTWVAGLASSFLCCLAAWVVGASRHS